MPTRFQEFRRRNNAQSQAKQGATFVLMMCIYFYILFQSYGSTATNDVVELNLQRSRDEWMEGYYELQRREMSKGRSKEDKNLLKAEAREAIEIWKFNQTSVLLKGENSTTLDKSSSSVPSTASVVADALARILNAFVTAFGLIFISRIFVRLCRSPQSIAALRRLREARFRQWADTLNEQRQSRGERPLSVRALRQVTQERNDGNDYMDLLEFQREAGPAIQAALESMGATEEEIGRLPSRVLANGDDLLEPISRYNSMPHCAVCLEEFVVGESVRTLPCFHSYHKSCIDRWLAEKAQCPVCKRCPTQPS